MITGIKLRNFFMDDSDRFDRVEARSDIALMKDVAYGNMKAFKELIDRYLDLVSRTAFRILCDRRDSEYVTARVFVALWNDVLDYDDRFTVREWLLRKTCFYSRIRITHRRILRIFGIQNDVFVNVSPKVENADDYVTKQAWELHCKAVSHMTPLQGMAYALCVLEMLPVSDASMIIGMTGFRVGLALDRAERKVKDQLKDYGKQDEYDSYNGFLRKVSDSITDLKKLKRMIVFSV